VEVVGDSSKTRLLHEDVLPNKESVDASINELFSMFGGTAVLPPHLPEGRFIGSMSNVHPDIVFARITGHLRPIGAWMVAVPPALIRAGVADGNPNKSGTPTKLTDPITGPIIDPNEYQREVLNGSRPGLPRDGRYWVALIESNEVISRLAFENPATYDEAQDYLFEFELRYSPIQRITTFHVDDVAGVWTGAPGDKPIAMLAIFHPMQLNDPVG
jgi:hypothetical protein